MKKGHIISAVTLAGILITISISIVIQNDKDLRPPVDLPGDKDLSPSVDLPGYTLSWQDEFDGTALDLTKWRISTGTRRNATNTAAAVNISDGLLTITTFTESGVHYTCYLDTSGKYEPRYGFMEARIRFFSNPGEWGAFWLNSKNMGNISLIGQPDKAGVEIDVMEHRAVDGSAIDVSGRLVSTIHWDGYGTDHKKVTSGLLFAKPDATSITGEWHIYGVLWTESGYIFYFNGNPYWSTSSAVSKVNENLKLTCEVQNNSWAGNIPASGYGSLAESNTQMEVDWVRVWQKS